MRAVLIPMFALAASYPSSAIAQDCKRISDPTARLACFDKGGAVRSPKAAKPRAADPFSDAKAAILRKLKDPGSAQWRDLFTVSGQGGPLVCGSVNSKNAMGGYVGFRGFVYEPSIWRATIMLSGASDPEYTVAAAATFCTYCVPDPRSEKSVAPHCPGLISAARRSLSR